MSGAGDLIEMVQRLILTLIPMILSLTVHECAHAASAYALGDRTAKDAGRLTLNPGPHIDVLGTLILPGFAAIVGGVPFFGWARPTPFRADRFRKGVNPRLGAAIVSAAGPLSNIALSLLSIAILALLARAHVSLWTVVQDGDDQMPRPTGGAALLFTLFQLNLGLAAFNLIPVPPLDGHRLLPPQFDPLLRPLARYGLLVLLGVMFFLPQVANQFLYAPLQHLTWAIAGWFLG